MKENRDEEPKSKELLVVESDTSVEQSTIVAQNRATYIVEKVLSSPTVRALGRKNKLSASQTAAVGLAIAMTLEELDSRNRHYRVAEQGFLVSIFGRLFHGSRPVQINVEAPENSVPIHPSSSLWDRIGWGGITAILAITLVGAAFYAQRSAQTGPAWQSTSDAYKRQVELLSTQLKDANTKRDEYADKLLELNRYVGTFEGQASAQTADQKATAQKLRDILGKVDDIQESQRQNASDDKH